VNPVEDKQKKNREIRLRQGYGGQAGESNRETSITRTITMGKMGYSGLCFWGWVVLNLWKI
jgi:hypothetical protein